MGLKMWKLSREAKIGLFLGVTLLILALFIFVVGDLSRLFRPAGYPLLCSFDSALGIEKHTVIRLAGVKIGYVKNIQLVENRALVTMNIYPAVKVPRDSKAFLASLGLLGERYIEILPGKEKAAFLPGEEMASMPSVSFDQLGLLLVSIGEEIKEVSSTLRRLLGPEEKENLSLVLNNLASISQDMQALLESSRPQIEKGVAAFSRTSDELGSEIKRLSHKLQEVASSLEEFIEINRDEIQKTLITFTELSEKLKTTAENFDRLMERLEKGEGTMGRLLQDPGLYDQAQKTVSQASTLIEKLARMNFEPDIKADYLVSPRKLRGGLSLSLWPEGKENQPFFTFGLVRDPDQDGFLWNFQGGVKRGVFQGRAGIIESELGVGIDAGPIVNRFFLSVESFDFNRSEGPRWRLFSRYEFFRNFYFTLGVDDLGVRSKRSLLLGFGARR